MVNDLYQNNLVIYWLILLTILGFSQKSFSKDLHIRVCTRLVGTEENPLGIPAKYIIIIPKEYPKKADYTKVNGCVTLIFDETLVGQSLTLNFYNNNRTSIDSMTEKMSLNKLREFEGNYRFDFPFISIKDNYESEDDSIKTIEALSELIKSHPKSKSKVLPYGGGVLAVLLLALRSPTNNPPSETTPDTSDTLGTYNNSDFYSNNSNLSNLLSFAYNHLSRSIGFRFTSKQNIEDVVFWNPSVIALSKFNMRSFSFNYSKRFLSSNLMFPVSDKISLGIGFLSLGQVYPHSPIPSSNRKQYKSSRNYEWAILFSVSTRLRKNFSIGFNSKYLSQNIEVMQEVETTPQILNKSFFNYETTIIKEILSESILDFDLSATFDLTPSIRIGSSMMNVRSNKILNYDGSKGDSRSLGIGISYTKNLIEIGSEIKFSKNKRKSMGLGFGFEPLNALKVNVGIDTEFQTFTLGTKYKSVNWAINQNQILGTSSLVGVSFGF